MEIESLLSADGLLPIVRQHYQPNDDTVEVLGNFTALFLDSPAPSDSLARLTVSVWALFKEEMRLLICTDDKKYAEVRKQLVKGSKKSQTVILTTITAALAPYVGVVAGALVPLSAITLFAVAKAGKNALCAGHDLEVKIDH